MKNSLLYRTKFDRENPFVAASSGNSLIFHTGTQRSERPIFVRKIAPCQNSCPIGINLSSALYEASRGNIDEALRIFLEENPLPGVTGRVCYHACESQCNRGQFDEPINIRAIERFVADHGKVNFTELPRNTRKERIAVIGSGPAGLSCAYHLAKRGYPVTIFEQKAEPGGMLRYGIPTYRLPRETLERDIQRILSLGITLQCNTTISESDTFDATFYSVGLQKGKSSLNDPSVLSGLVFLANPSQWSLENQKEKVAIIGGGNVGIDVARVLTRIRGGNAENITLFSPESASQMPADPEEVKEAIEEGITIINGRAPSKLIREGESLFLETCSARVTTDEEGHVIISIVDNETQKHKVDRIITAIGQELDFVQLPTRDGRILADVFCRVSPTVYAGGDATGTKAFVADAIASGKMAALSIASALEGKTIEDEYASYRLGTNAAFSLYTKDKNLQQVVPFERINTLLFTEASRNNPDVLPASVRKASFDEVSCGISESAFESEVNRCFKCGTCTDCHYCLDFCPDISIVKDVSNLIVDYDYCKGCGMCFTVCPRNVIEMVREQ